LIRIPTHEMKESQFTDVEHRRAHRFVISIWGSYGQSGGSLNVDRWRWIPAFQLSLCGRREQTEMHFLRNTHCCTSLTSLHFIWTSVLLVQNSSISAPSHSFCLFNSIPIQPVIYQSGLFHGTFIPLHCRILDLQGSSHHLFLFYGKEADIILLLTIWHDIKLTAQECLCVFTQVSKDSCVCE